jgi:hypothetical protein
VNTTIPVVLFLATTVALPDTVELIVLIARLPVVLTFTPAKLTMLFTMTGMGLTKVMLPMKVDQQDPDAPQVPVVLE